MSVVYAPTNKLLLSATIPRINQATPTPTPTATPTPDPSDPGHAYLDKNGNGEWDEGTDTKIPDSEISDGMYDAGSDEMVIPESVGDISANRIDLRGATITVEEDLTATGDQDISITTGSGVLTMEDITVKSQSNRQIQIETEGVIRANGTTIDSGQAITLKSNTGEVHLSGGSVEATDQDADIQLTSDGDMYVESMTLAANDGRSIFKQRENPAVHGGRESRPLRATNHRMWPVWNPNA